VLRREDWHLTYRWARRIAISIVGGTVLAIGVAMIVLPGPALIVIPLGLAILGVEYAWARRWLRKVKVRTAYYMSRVKGSGKKPPEADGEADQPDLHPPAARRQEPPPPGVT
jgi:tellurite resistance protein TerC